jgi:CRP-like cAMP-binding protein
MTLIMFFHVIHHQRQRRILSGLEHTFDVMIFPIDVLLKNGAQEKSYSSGEVIFEEGRVCSYYMQVKSGKVKWMNFSDDGRESKICLERGESISITFSICRRSSL